ncbi:hypothetical protein, partial [Eubacterium callanderi]|uniref:hypothetical protein n=1 Tax=Eubacterium callanderi TaxID=53442 RepID=UPI003AF05683
MTIKSCRNQLSCGQEAYAEGVPKGTPSFLFSAIGGQLQMGDVQVFDYYYGDESSQFSFYRIPRPL